MCNNNSDDNNDIYEDFWNLFDIVDNIIHYTDENKINEPLRIPLALLKYKELATLDVIVYSILHQYCKTIGTKINISNKTIAEISNSNISSIKCSIKKLVDLKIIKIEKAQSKYRTIALNIDYFNGTYEDNINENDIKIPLLKNKTGEYIQSPYIEIPDNIYIYSNISYLDAMLYGLLYKYKDKKISTSKLGLILNRSRTTISLSLKKLEELKIIKIKNNYYSIIQDFFEKQ